MADCGASGTALDQAARAFMGGGNTGNGQAQKQIGNLLGHATLSGVSAQNALPISRSDQLAIQASGGDALLALPQQRLQQQQQQQQVFYGPAHTTRPHLHYHHHHQQQQHHPTSVQMQQQQHHIIAMQHHQHQQQHQLMMMQHQNHMMMQAQHSQALQQRQKQQAALKQTAESRSEEEATRLEKEVHYTDEGIVQGATIDELATAWTEAQAQEAFDVLGHEGNVQDVTIESLAAAWSKAQDEYYQSDEFIADPSDMYHPETAGDQDYMPTYKFTNEFIEGKTELPHDANFMARGFENFKEGNIKEAIRNFEMELQINDPDNATAWRMLGRCHAENDQDREAIVCLEIAVERDPFSPESQLALGVSYVNELNHAKALAALKNWVSMNPKYAGMDLDAGGEDVYGDGGHNSDSEFQELQRLLLKALEYDNSDSADVWEALGVAANVSRDFETAIEAFQKAIDARPDDYQLWNKLGATLANGNQSDKALPAYHNALQLKPKYARAWLNMAISHSNMHNFDEASRCYLQTLSLNPAAVHCWSYLRVALSCSERWDLIPFAASQNLEAFQEHFDFVTYQTE